jgi:hypothetical protein
MKWIGKQLTRGLLNGGVQRTENSEKTGEEQRGRVHARAGGLWLFQYKAVVRKARKCSRTVA